MPLIIIKFYFSERTLEDHEDILETDREAEVFSPYQERKFFFRVDSKKYDFFVNPLVRFVQNVKILYYGLNFLTSARSYITN